MLSKIRQRLWEVGQSLAGEGMLPRLRNSSIALLGAVAAVGLGLTVFISQLSFPAVFSGPIPGAPAKVGSVHNAIALTHSSPAAPPSPALGLRSRSRVVAAGRKVPAGHHGGDSGQGGSPKVAVSPGTKKQGPAQPQPTAVAPVAAPPAPQAESSPPAPSPAVAESPPKSSSGGPTVALDGKSKSSGPSTAKVTSDVSGKSGTSTAKSGKSDGRTTSVGSSGSPVEKAGKDKSSASPPKSVAPPPSPPSVKAAPETVSPAAAKEASDSGESDKSHH